MERYGGHEVKPGITSRWFPYSSLDQYILRKTRLRQLGIIYGISEKLTLQAAKEEFNPQFHECELTTFIVAPLLTSPRSHLSIFFSQAHTTSVKVAEIC